MQGEQVSFDWPHCADEQHETHIRPVRSPRAGCISIECTNTQFFDIYRIVNDLGPAAIDEPMPDQILRYISADANNPVGASVCKAA
jgi:hypothetical protein